MTLKNDIFTDWLSRLPILSFVDYGKDKSRMKPECVRTDMIDSLELLGNVRDPKIEFARKRLLLELKKIKIVEIKTQKATRGKDRILYTQAAIQIYIQKWKIKDGAAVGIISDYFCDAVRVNPGDFLRMSVQEKIFNEWLKYLPDQSFVDYGGGCIDLDRMRLEMVDSLESLGMVKDSKVEFAREKLLAKLKKIKIRKID